MKLAEAQSDYASFMRRSLARRVRHDRLREQFQRGEVKTSTFRHENDLLFREQNRDEIATGFRFQPTQ